MGDAARSASRARPPHDPKIKARYDLLIKRFGHLRLLQMTDYHCEGEVETTTFEDGTRVTADFANENLHVNGKRIDRPEDPENPHASKST